MNCCIEGRKRAKEVCCYIILKNYLSVCSDLFCTANNQQIHGIMRDTQEITKLELHMNWENPRFWVMMQRFCLKVLVGMCESILLVDDGKVLSEVFMVI